MASKKSVNSEDETLAPEETLEEETGAEETGEAETAQEETPAKAEEERVKLVYIGPSLPFGKLRKSMILEGTESQIWAFLGEMRDLYPELPYLLVKPEELPEAMKKVSAMGNVLHKYYNDLLAKSRAGKKG
jgi:hypothetical protein